LDNRKISHFGQLLWSELSAPSKFRCNNVDNSLLPSTIFGSFCFGNIMQGNPLIAHVQPPFVAHISTNFLVSPNVYSFYDSIFCLPSKIVFYDPEFGSATKLQ